MSAPVGLEVWLIGTPAEVDAAACALAHLGRIAYHSDGVPMAGADAGRVRVYARIYVTARRDTEGAPAAPAPTASTAPTLLDLAA